MDDTPLEGGYAVASSSLNAFGLNCDDVISAETLMMVKEHFIKQFGPPARTIGLGDSGGSMAQYLIAQNYPGLVDGIIPGLSFPDHTTFIASGVDCSLLEHAFNSASQPWTEEQKSAVTGFYSWRTCTDMWLTRTFYSPSLVRAACSENFTKALIHEPVTNRAAVRCDIYDNEVNSYGRDPATGFARRPWDNVGIQYGLAAFNAGRISVEQFLDLNRRVGGYDND